MRWLHPYAIRPQNVIYLAFPQTEKYDASIRTILLELDFDEESIDTLPENGAISESWSREYLPS